jgi:hypothetical protein
MAGPRDNTRNHKTKPTTYPGWAIFRAQIDPPAVPAQSDARDLLSESRSRNRHKKKHLTTCVDTFSLDFLQDLLLACSGSSSRADKSNRRRAYFQVPIPPALRSHLISIRIEPDGYSWPFRPPGTARPGPDLARPD